MIHFIFFQYYQLLIFQTSQFFWDLQSCGRGINCVAPDGRAARTVFQGIAYNESSNLSLVICRLYTGRTHQIRVHLQWLGYPIYNDPLYNNDKVDKLKNFFDTINIQRFKEPENDASEANVSPLVDSDIQKEKTEAPNEIELECLDCRAHFEDPKPDDLYQYLHSYAYTSKDWSFKTELPIWAVKLFQINPESIPDLSQDDQSISTNLEPTPNPTTNHEPISIVDPKTEILDNLTPNPTANNEPTPNPTITNEPKSISKSEEPL